MFPYASSRVQMLVHKVDFLTAALMQKTDALQKMVCTATQPAHRACNRACTTTEPATEPCIATEPPTEPASADKRETGRKLLDRSSEIPAPPPTPQDFLGNLRQGSASKQLVHVSSKQPVDACDVRQEKPRRDTPQAKATRKHRSLTLTPRSGPLTPTPRSVCQALGQVAESERPVRLTPLKNDVLVSTSETQPNWLEVLQSSAGKGHAPEGGAQRKACDTTRRDPVRATMQKGAAQANWLSAGVAAGDGHRDRGRIGFTNWTAYNETIK